MAKLFLLALLILINLTSDVLASDDIGYKHYLKGEYEKALKVWTQEVSQGKSEAMYNIALLYFFGRGVERNLPLAYEYCKKAAYRGSARAMNNLAYMYMRGLGTEKDYMSAYAWSEIAIENGYNSKKLRDDASMHLTPAMHYDVHKFINELKKEIKRD